MLNAVYNCVREHNMTTSVVLGVISAVSMVALCFFSHFLPLIPALLMGGCFGIIILASFYMFIKGSVDYDREHYHPYSLTTVPLYPRKDSVSYKLFLASQGRVAISLDDKDVERLRGEVNDVVYHIERATFWIDVLVQANKTGQTAVVDKLHKDMCQSLSSLDDKEQFELIWSRRDDLIAIECAKETVKGCLIEHWQKMVERGEESNEDLLKFVKEQGWLQEAVNRIGGYFKGLIQDYLSPSTLTNIMTFICMHRVDITADVRSRVQTLKGQGKWAEAVEVAEICDLPEIAKDLCMERFEWYKGEVEQHLTNPLALKPLENSCYKMAEWVANHERYFEDDSKDTCYKLALSGVATYCKRVQKWWKKKESEIGVCYTWDSVRAIETAKIHFEFIAKQYSGNSKQLLVSCIADIEKVRGKAAEPFGSDYDSSIDYLDGQGGDRRRWEHRAI